VSNAVFDIYIMIGFGVVGYLMKKFEYEGAPLVLAFVLGPLFEVNLRKSLILSHGDFSIFVTRPISACSLIIAVLLLLSPLIPALSKKREAIAKEETS
jgi:putative tricarboxylic transport membrane protein